MPEPIDITRLRTARPGLDSMDLRQASPMPSRVAGKSFGEVLAETVGEVQRLQTEADTTIKKLVAGEIKDVSDAIIAVEKADVAFQTMMTVRNKMIEAYQEIMRMQV